MKYFTELERSMEMLSKHPDTIFLGQAVEYGGTGMYDTLTKVPPHKKMEFPVAEYLQCGVVNGLAIQGMIPVSIIPRWNFLLMGTDQIVNHLDKFKLMSNGRCTPKAIIRVAVGSEHPVDPQDQHKGNFSEMFRYMLKTIDVIELLEPEDIYPAYEKALYREDGRSTIVVEYSDYAKTK